MFEQAGKKNSNNTTYQFWQQHNQPIEVSCDADRLVKALNYIHENPVKEGFADSAENYPYSSAVDYSEKKGLIKIEQIR